MRTQRLGRAGIEVSQLTFGTANFGWLTPEPEARRMLDRAFELGINCIDTADSYGEARGQGLAEQIVGRWLADHPERRDHVVVLTKLYAQMSDDPNQRGLSAYHVRRACEASLRRLKTDHIDLYQMHHVDRAVTWEEVWYGLGLLQSQGKITYVGSSNFAAWQIAWAHSLARSRQLLGLTSEQSVYNLTCRTVELEVLPACEALGLGFFAYSPLAGGALAGSGDGAGRRAHPNTVELSRKYASRIKEYQKLCVELGLGPASLALAWAVSRKGVTSVILGPRTLQHLEAAVEASSIELSSDTVHRLEKLWPGPGGPAPEAYAW